MKIWFTAIAVTLTLVLQGCAVQPQVPVPMASDYYAGKSNRIGVVMSSIPKPDTQFPGAGCLLCIAVASAANSALTTAVQTWTTDDLRSLKAELIAVLKSKSQDVADIAEAIEPVKLPDRAAAAAGTAKKDFSSWRAKHGIDRLLVVDVSAVGAWRNYSAYVANGPPRAVVKLEAYIVDLQNHKYDWYKALDLSQMSEGNWDEPPKYPGMTNAYFQVIERAKDDLKKAIAP